jgi:hypothetical protein
MFISNFQLVLKSTVAFFRLGLMTIRSGGVAFIRGIKHTINSLIRSLRDLFLITAAFFTLRSLVVSYKTFFIINSFIRRSNQFNRRLLFNKRLRNRLLKLKALFKNLLIIKQLSIPWPALERLFKDLPKILTFCSFVALLSLYLILSALEKEEA